jgi:hypothetical protein
MTKEGRKPIDPLVKTYAILGYPASPESLTRRRFFGIAKRMDEKMTVSEMGARGGKSRSEKKLAASTKNLAKARVVKAEKSKALGRGLAWTKQQG